MSISAERRVRRARVAAYKRHHPDRPDLIEREQTELRALGLEAHIRRLLDGSSPSLTAQQRQRLAALLTSGEEVVHGVVA